MLLLLLLVLNSVAYPVRYVAAAAGAAHAVHPSTPPGTAALTRSMGSRPIMSCSCFMSRPISLTSAT
jgi:hypothetical protein